MRAARTNWWVALCTQRFENRDVLGGTPGTCDPQRAVGEGRLYPPPDILEESLSNTTAAIFISSYVSAYKRLLAC